MSLLVSVLEVASYEKKPTGDDWTSRVILSTERVVPSALLNAYKSIYEAQFLSRKPPAGEDTSAVVSSKFSCVTKAFVLSSMCRLVNTWAGARDGSTTHSRNQITLAISYCQSLLEMSLQDNNANDAEVLQAAQQVLRTAQGALAHGGVSGYSPMARIV